MKTAITRELFSSKKPSKNAIRKSKKAKTAHQDGNNQRERPRRSPIQDTQPFHQAMGLKDRRNENQCPETDEDQTKMLRFFATELTKRPLRFLEVLEEFQDGEPKADHRE